MTVRGPVTILVGAALALGVTACGNVDDRAEGPTVAEVQQQALAAQPAPVGAAKYPPLPLPDPASLPLQPDPVYNGPVPPVPPSELQPGQDPVATALNRIQLIAATTADMSNKFEEARDYFRGVEPYLDVVDGEIDDKQWDELKAGIDDMHKALDKAAANSNHGGDAGKLEVFRSALVDAEKASGRIQLAVTYALDHWYDDE